MKSLLIIVYLFPVAIIVADHGWICAEGGSMVLLPSREPQPATATMRYLGESWPGVRRSAPAKPKAPVKARRPAKTRRRS